MASKSKCRTPMSVSVHCMQNHKKKKKTRVCNVRSCNFVLRELIKFNFLSGDLGLIPGRVIPKTLKMVLDTSLLDIQQYKVCIKGNE